MTRGAGWLARERDTLKLLNKARSLLAEARNVLPSAHNEADALGKITADLQQLCLKIDHRVLLTLTTVPRPTRISEPHALDRLMERHMVSLVIPDDRDAARTLLQILMTRVRLIEWDPSDLDGLGQAIWEDAETRIRLSVDGKGLVRTVLPRPQRLCGYIVDNYTNEICGGDVPCTRHP